MLDKIQLALGAFLMFGSVGSMETDRMSFAAGTTFALIGIIVAMNAVSRMNLHGE